MTQEEIQQLCGQIVLGNKLQAAPQLFKLRVSWRPEMRDPVLGAALYSILNPSLQAYFKAQILVLIALYHPQAITGKLLELFPEGEDALLVSELLVSFKQVCRGL